MSEPTQPNGELLLPVCIPRNEIRDLISAIDLYRVMRKGGQEYVAFNAVLQAVDRIDAPETAPCLDVSDSANSGSCFRMDTTTEIFQFYPNNPFDRTDDERTVSGMSWVRFGDIVQTNAPEWLQNALDNVADRVGYFENDCFIDYNVTGNPFADITNRVEDFFNAFRDKNLNPFPTVTFRFSGTGQLEIEFAQVPFGGAVLVTWDFNPELNDILDIVQGKPTTLTNFQLIEVNRDLIGLPPELVTTTIFEREFDDDIEHVVRCYFTPSGQLEPPFFLPFGGIREVEFCGVSAIGSETGNTYNQFNYRGAPAIRKGVLPVSTVDDFYDALVRWNDERAVRWLAGQSRNVRDGLQLEPRDEGFDIELRGIVERGRGVEIEGVTNQEVLFGQALSVGRGFRELVAELVTWESNGVTKETIVQRLAQLYKFGFGIDLTATPVVQFGNDLQTLIDAATLNTTPVVDPVAIANFVYCNGNNKQSLYRYALDVEENGAVSPLDIANFYRLLIDNLEESQLNDWYEDPESVPDTGFTNAPCYRFPSIQVTVDHTQLVSAVYYDFSPPYSVTLPSGGSRKYRMEAKGKIILSDGKMFNGHELLNADGTFNRVIRVDLDIGNEFRIDNTSEYQSIGDKLIFVRSFGNGGTLSSHRLRIVEDTNGRFDNPQSGSVTYTLFDLGQP